MPSSFLLTLDRQTQIGVSINGGAGSTQNDTVTLELELDPDAVQVKIWGDINPLDPANSEYGETEEKAPWITASPSFLVNLTTNQGLKTLSARVRDDVDNEAVGSASIVLGEEVAPPPVKPPSQRPKPLPGSPEPPRPEPELLEVTAFSQGVALATSATVLARTASRSRGVTLRTTPGLVQGRALRRTPVTLELSTSVDPYVTAAVNRPGVLVGAASTKGSVQRRDDPELLGALAALGEL